MQLRWSEEAASDLERITNYLFEETPQHAPELVRAIYKAPSALLTFPHRTVVYRIAGDAVHILRILHGAQKWPPGSST